jgi:uncharacterized membrane protein YtjA (UPF0391 family)
MGCHFPDRCFSGFTVIAGAAATFAKILFGLFLGICILLFLLALLVGKKIF